MVFAVAAGCLPALCRADLPAYKADSMGPHMNYGRGCSECHVPHSSAVKLDAAQPANFAEPQQPLWGEVGSEGGLAQVPQARSDAGSRENAREAADIINCLGCHDGNYASAAMSKNIVYESIPEPVYGTVDPVPTFADKPSEDRGSDISQHPVGSGALIRCGGSGNWDCSQRDGMIVMDGPLSSMFAANYGFFLKPYSSGSAMVVLCTTCHNPHSRTVTSISNSAGSNIFRGGVYSTEYFLRAPYDPENATRSGNQSAQFCRQCHADLSNEMYGRNVATTM